MLKFIFRYNDAESGNCAHADVDVDSSKRLDKGCSSIREPSPSVESVSASVGRHSSCKHRIVHSQTDVCES